MNRKIFLNKWHIIILILALTGWLILLGNSCNNIKFFEAGIVMGDYHLDGFFECMIYRLINGFLLFTLISLVILYFIITLISWLCYRKKK